VDCHSKFIAVCVFKVLEGNRVKRWERSYKATLDGLRAARGWVLGLLDVPAESLRYTLESTGCYHIPVLLTWAGIPTVINPALAGETRRKTDKLDAKKLALQGLISVWAPTFVAPGYVRECKALFRVRRQLQQMAHRRLLSIGSHLLSFGTAATALGSVGDSSIRPIVEDFCSGRVKASDYRDVLMEGLPTTIKEAILVAYKDYDALTLRVKEAEKVYLKRVRDEKWPTGKGLLTGRRLSSLLTTAPGVGELTAAAWLHEIGDVTRFPKSKAVGAYCGFDPSLKVSAGEVTAHVRRKGNAILHRMLIQAAQTAMRMKGPVADWAAGIRGRKGKGGYQKAVGAVGRRLAHGLYFITLNQENWQWHDSSSKNKDNNESSPA
jgi:transposase